MADHRTPWRNSSTRWGSVARALHWTIAGLVLAEVAAGLIMARTFGGRDPASRAWQYWTSNVHHTAGLAILMLAAVRALWRLSGPVPDPVAAVSARVALAARATHLALYALLLLVPLTGWAALSSLADSRQYGPTVLWFFGRNGFGGVVPRIVPPVPFQSHQLLRYGNLARSHVWLLWSGAAVLSLHVLAALRHHFVLRDATLTRMWRS